MLKVHNRDIVSVLNVSVLRRFLERLVVVSVLKLNVSVSFGLVPFVDIDVAA